MKAWMSVSAAEVDRLGWRRAIFPRWKKAFGNMVNMEEEGESGVQDNSKVTDFG